MEQVKRVASAVCLLPPLILCILYLPPSVFLLLIVLIVALSVYEYFTLLGHVQASSCRYVAGLASLAMTLAAYSGGLFGLQMALYGSVIALTVSVMVTSSPITQLWPLFVSSMIGVLLLGWTLSHLIVLRLLPEGPWYLLFLCAVVWVGDSLAMYVGKCLGHHKLAPAISPGKTWEGAVGGLVGGVCTAVIGAHFWLPHLTWWQRILLGGGLALVAQLSDLSESMLKRYGGVKDSGHLIPGHGGILDRMDSMLFAAPALVYALHVL